MVVVSFKKVYKIKLGDPLNSVLPMVSVLVMSFCY